MSNQYIFQANDRELYFEHLYSAGGYLTFNIGAKSGAFAGAFHFCIKQDHLQANLDNLELMAKDLKGSCQIMDFESDSFIVLECSEQKLGHLEISGQLGGSYEENYLKFKYEADQTVLNRLVEYLKPSLL